MLGSLILAIAGFGYASAAITMTDRSERRNARSVESIRVSQAQAAAGPPVRNGPR